MVDDDWAGWSPQPVRRAAQVTANAMIVNCFMGRMLEVDVAEGNRRHSNHERPLAGGQKARNVAASGMNMEPGVPVEMKYVNRSHQFC